MLMGRGESNASVLCLRYLLTICLPRYDPKIMGVQQRYIFLYGWNIACVLVPSIIHSFRTDENYVTRLKTDET